MTNSREKGKRGERAARRLFWRWFPHCCRSGSVQADDDGYYPDLLASGPFYVEVKFHHKISQGQLRLFWEKLISDWAQYERRWERDTKPILMWKEDRKDWRVAMHVQTAKEIEVVKGRWSEFAFFGQVELPWDTFSHALDQLYRIQPPAVKPEI